MSVITANTAMSKGAMSTDEYCEVVRSVLSDEDPEVVLSASASIATAFLALASRGVNLSVEELLRVAGASLQS